MNRTAPAAVALHLECLEAAWESLWTDWRSGVERAARAALAALPPPAGPAALSLVLTNDAHIRELNRDYRGKDRPTNVLSFPQDDAAAAAEQGRVEELGDVILALETVREESLSQNKSLEQHSVHLIVHGILHIFGYDHAAPDTAETMESLERAILAQLGLPDPYRDRMSAAGEI
jgi:probable rRNA maturation factor